MKRVEGLTHLKRLSLEKRAVICPKHPAWDRPRPAAFVINLSGFLLDYLFASGMFVYETKGGVKNANLKQ